MDATKETADDQSTITASAMSAGDVTTTKEVAKAKEEPLEYPHNFFDPKTGAPPDDAGLLWQWRKNRPPKGTRDTVAPDAAAMSKEIEDMRYDLRMYIIDRYLDFVREEAERQDWLLNPVNELAGHPRTRADIVKLVKTLEDTRENWELVYRVFHHTTRSRDWLANMVDEWFDRRKMVMLTPPRAENDDGKKTKIFKNYRGGFGAVGRQAKSEALGQYMRPLVETMLWKVAISDKSKKSQDSVYTRQTIQIGKQTFVYYHVKDLGEVSYLSNISDVHYAVTLTR